MKFMSFNTMHCASHPDNVINYELMARTILDCGADVIGLNEIRGESTGAPDPAFGDQVGNLSKLTGIKNYFFAPAIMVGGCKPYGNAMLSKLPIISVENIIIPDPDDKIFGEDYETRCVIKAKLEGDITLLVTHFGLYPDEQVNATKTLLKHITDKRCILMGDFNVGPDNHLMEILRERMVDTAAFFTEPKLSFPSDNPRVKIDYIFVSPDVEVVSADIPAIVASDHRPCTAEVNFK
ncbi:MAG: endonuclease/exonuclease/phosphatase family protein [Clostridia bacterium]|nr:endonuclease/exonuclease/phosphatase family protein [Clostridia bacterium]